MGAALACTLTPEASPEPASPSEPEANTPDEPSPDVAEPAPATEEPAGVESARMPEVAAAESQIVYDQAQRSTLGGRDTFFWPDGNIGFIPYNGQYRFFAANGVVTARTVGTLEDPGAIVEADRQPIEGASSEFAYLAGGPIYRDPDSGMLIMFYHAERHLDGVGLNFHAALGLAVSNDDGETFQNLGIILETNAEPDINARCCADMAGAPFAIKDGQFYLYFRDRNDFSGSLQDVNLAVATAPVDEVVAAARAGTTSDWLKYNGTEQTPGLGGRSLPLEIGNPQTSWFSVSYNTALEQFIMVIARHGLMTDPAELYLIASEDGYTWSPRVELSNCDCELTYPSIISPDGNPYQTGDTFYVYYVATPPDQQFRWHQTPLHRMTVTLTGEMMMQPHEWEFEADAEGWTPLNQIDRFEVVDGALVVEPTGVDPYMESPTLGLSTDEFATIEVRMKVGADGTAQFFFTGSEVPGTNETNSKRFPVQGSDDFITYKVDMSEVPGWDGLLSQLRFDPTDQQTPLEIDFIRVLP
jgi:hypothetical protein